MSFFGPLFYFILALSLLVLVHEWGHFYVARRSGVRVLRFSIGFGPELLGWSRGDTRYSISAIPFGGYVKFAGDNPEEERDESSDEFLSQSLGVRSAIVIAGPLMNYLLAIVLFAAALYFGGIETIGTTRIGMVEENSVASTVGIRADDVLQTINGEPVEDWYDVGVQLTEIGAGDAFELVVEREGRSEVLTGSAPALKGFADTTLGVSPFAETLIGRVQPDGPASEAGLLAGDRIRTVDGSPVDRWTAMAEIIRSRPDTEVPIEWEREGELLAGRVTPRAVEIPTSGGTETIGQIGIEQNVARHKVGAVTALVGGWERTWWLTRMVLELLPRIPSMIFKSIFQGDDDGGLGGPVRMAQLFGEAASLGILTFLATMASISTQLAIFNLLPIPVLDGGHLALYLVEFVTRRPPSIKVKIVLQQIGFALLILLMLSVTVMDVGRLFG